MTLSESGPGQLNSDARPDPKPATHGAAWYQPIWSPEHGVYVVLLAMNDPSRV